jgi:heme-degrading monooxygenase HmoA
MSFIVVNSVKASKEDLPAVVMDVQRLGLDVLRTQPGFKSARLMAAEDREEAMLIIEWVSREHFVAYRQSSIGRALVDEGAKFHPQISFYDVIAAYDSAS